MLQKHINMTSDAIIACYQGDHRLCLSQSTVCMGDSDNNWPVKSEYLPYFFKLKVKIGSEKVLQTVLTIVLGRALWKRPNLIQIHKKLNLWIMLLDMHCLKMWHLPGIFQEGLIVQSSNATMVPERQYWSFVKQLAVLSLQIVKRRLDFWPNRNVLKTTKCVVGPQKEKSSVNLGEIIFTKLYEKHQEKISYRKAQLLLKKAKTRQLRAKVSKDHCYTLKSCTLRQTTKKTTKQDHTYSITTKSNHPIPKCKMENAPSCSFQV